MGVRNLGYLTYIFGEDELLFYEGRKSILIAR
jgi:hypothetical protein